ncbi:metallophosphoesterase [Allorhizobium taibaishanense]|uniref:Metallophosphoesterase n=1 Tax=Allorhizobium taibaishanense TaxID=887144 RepID=A0A1Q9A3R8_9HYPH|nr:metallophosphoesterase [Allorhizobium taibaishanense]MBB4006142.1 hypothetical protein [Allorhizobium taibaishanense]OLP49138.1 metallophosphoesterase [Allorhizobium taibaishanense]
MFHVIFGLPWLIVLVRFIEPLPWLWSVKTIVAIILLLASQYHLISRISSGSVFSPELPRPAIIAFNFLLGALFLLALFQIALDLVSLMLMAVKGHFPLVPPVLRYIIGGVALALSAIGVGQAIRVPPLKDIEIAIPRLPPAFDGYQLIQLTDLHISRLFPAPWAAAVISKANELDADMIVISGDLIDGDLDHRRADVEPLAKLRARDGVYAIPGNHEYFFDQGAWMAHFKGLGLTMLENAHVVIERQGQRLTLAGVNDLSAARAGSPVSDLPLAIRNAPADAPIILLDHQPMQAERSAAAGVALQLSGHTHGGMIVGFDRLFARANNGFVSGLYQVGAMQLYVNNGTALWPGFALRLGKPSELTRITLRRSD